MAPTAFPAHQREVYTRLRRSLPYVRTCCAERQQEHTCWRCGQHGIVAEVGCGPTTRPTARLLDCPEGSWASTIHSMQLQMSALATRCQILLDDGPMIWLASKPEAHLVTQARKNERPASPSDADTTATTWTRDNGSPIPALGSEAAQTDSLLRSSRKGCATLCAGKDETLHGSPRSHGTTLPPSVLQPLLVRCVADYERWCAVQRAGRRWRTKCQGPQYPTELGWAALGGAWMRGQDPMGGLTAGGCLPAAVGPAEAGDGRAAAHRRRRPAPG